MIAPAASSPVMNVFFLQWQCFLSTVGIFCCWSCVFSFDLILFQFLMWLCVIARLVPLVLFCLIHALFAFSNLLTYPYIYNSFLFQFHFYIGLGAMWQFVLIFHINFVPLRQWWLIICASYQPEIYYPFIIVLFLIFDMSVFR